MKTFGDFFSYAVAQFLTIGPVDFIDIALVAVMIFFVIKFISDKRAAKLAIGICMILFLLIISQIFRMSATNFLFSNIRKHPEIKFDLFFPPYNIFFWCTLEKAGYTDGYLALRDYIIREAAKYPNVRLHDFQPDTTIVCNQDIYKDVTHYNVETGRLILQNMASGKHQIDVAAGVKNSQSIRQQIKQHMPEFLKLSPL